MNVLDWANRRRASTLAVVAIMALAAFATMLSTRQAEAADLDVCPMGCTHDTIQEAIDSAGIGDTITVAAGTYTENVEVAKSGITITGAGSGTTTIAPTSGWPIRLLGNTAGPIADVAISGFTLDPGDGTGGLIALSGTPNDSPYTTNLALTDIAVSGEGWGIVLNATSGATLTDVSLSGIAANPALELTGVSNLMIQSSAFTNNELAIRVQTTDGGPADLYGDNTGIDILGSDFTAPNGKGAIEIGAGTDDASITGNTLTDIGTADDGQTTVQAIYLRDASSNVAIEDNVIDGVGNSGTSGSNKGIYVGDTPSDGTVTNLAITGNVISNVQANTADFDAGGRGAYGILVNTGVSGAGSVNAPLIDDNTISGLSGFWTHGIGIEGPTPGATVTNNTISGLSAGGTGAVGIHFQDNPALDAVTVLHNKFTSGVATGVGIHANDVTLGVEVTADDNWWGSASGPGVGSNAEAGANVLVDTWCLDANCATTGDTPPPTGGGGGGSSDDDEPVTEGTIEDNDLEVEVEAGETTEVESGEDTVVGTESEDGSAVEVTAPEGALPEGGSLSAWAIADLDEALTQAPAPGGADIALGFVVQATDEDGNPVDGPFDPPLELEFALPADQVPTGIDSDRVTLVFWDGDEWVEVEATVVVNADGSLTLSASVDHLTVFAVAFQEATGTFEPAPAASGVSLAAWGGGTFEEIDAALQPGASVWVFVDGVAYGYTVGSPDFVNARFAALYPGGVPAGTLTIVSI